MDWPQCFGGSARPCWLAPRGWDLAGQNRPRALTSNLSNAFAAQGGIFLFPFILIGLWQLRHDLRTRIAATGWLILFAVMTVIFPFAGSRGSFFHAGAGGLPFLGGG